MSSRNAILALSAVSIGCFLSSPALAQRAGRHGGMPNTPHAPRLENPRPEKAQKTPIEEFETMPADQQQKALNRLPPAQRKQLEQRLQRFNKLPPEQQQALKNLYTRLHQLPPERQDAVRQAIQKFSEQGPNRQQAIRGELRDIAALPEPERQAHMASQDFRSRFSKKEQEVVRDMSLLLPSQ
jgi:hypothetical protein